MKKGEKRVVLRSSLAFTLCKLADLTRRLKFGGLVGTKVRDFRRRVLELWRCGCRNGWAFAEQNCAAGEVWR